jgi:hypothetical protein
MHEIVLGEFSVRMQFLQISVILYVMTILMMRLSQWTFPLSYLFTVADLS